MRNAEKSAHGVDTPGGHRRQRTTAQSVDGQLNPFVSMEFESRKVKWGPRETRLINHCSYTFRAGRPISTVRASHISKPELDFNGEMLIAEIAVLRLLHKAGWEGVWVDSWQNKKAFRNSLPPDTCGIPEHAQGFLETISGGKKWPRGCWDVFAWKEGGYIFIECKRKGRDSLRQKQKEWMEAALKEIPQESFIIFEWELA